MMYDEFHEEMGDVSYGNIIITAVIIKEKNG